MKERLIWICPLRQIQKVIRSESTLPHFLIFFLNKKEYGNVIVGQGYLIIIQSRTCEERQTIFLLSKPHLHILIANIATAASLLFVTLEILCWRKSPQAWKIKCEIYSASILKRVLSNCSRFVFFFHTECNSILSLISAVQQKHFLRVDFLDASLHPASREFTWSPVDALIPIRHISYQ